MKRLAIAILLLANNASAATTAGGNITIAPVAGTAPVRWPAIAYEAGRYLAVSGAGKVTGQFIADDGTPIGSSFAVNAGTNLAQAPRVCAANGKFLVTWHETVGSATRVRGRFVGAAPMGDDFDISPLGTNWEMGAASASLNTETLVAWQNPANEIVAQRVSDSGALVGAPITIATGRYHRDPAVVASGTEFLVAYAGCVADKNCFVEAQRVRDGALSGDRLVLDSSIDAGYVPEAAYNSKSGDVLVAWYRVTPAGKAFHARVVHKDGTLGSVVPFTTTGSYDANGLAYNPRSNSYLFVTHGDTSQDVALELSASGSLLTTVPFGPTGGGNFNPRVAANPTRPEWIAVTSTEFKTISAQRFATNAEPIAMPDVGLVMDAAMPDGDTASPPRDTGSAAVASEPVEGSCGCAVPGRTDAQQTASFLLLVLGCPVLARLRRRPRIGWRRGRDTTCAGS